MRRTYRSKKDIGGGLDPRDILQTLDDRSSAFDAFYIQNIKQTKQELSCMASSNQSSAVISKVRKKKYVKRLNKKVEPPVLETLQQSTCLTPDKSIHVNKGADLFDQLLNNMSPKQISTSNMQIERSKKFREKKAYGNRKAKKVTRINYTTSDSETSESDKENTRSKDVSNILQYRLQVEKDCNNDRPNYDDSINRVVNHISLINSLKNRNNLGDFGNVNNHRLTNMVQSPVPQGTSPLSSTPFTNKCRSKSIYKFSPIQMGNFEGSPDYGTIQEYNEEQTPEVEDVIHVERNNYKSTNELAIGCSPVTHYVTIQENNEGQTPEVEDASIHVERNNSKSTNELAIGSPVTHYVTIQKYNKEQNPEVEDVSIHVERNNSKRNNELAIGCSPVTHLHKKIKQSKLNSNPLFTDSSIIQNSHLENETVVKENVVNNEFGSRTEISKELLQLSEVESFHGFPPDSKVSDEVSEIKDAPDDFNNQSSILEFSEVNVSTPLDPFLGFTNVEQNISVNSESNTSENTVNSIKCNYSGNSDKDSSMDSEDTLDDNDGSLYESCSSENKLSDSENDLIKEPRVIIEKLSSSVFHKYYKNKLRSFKNDNESDYSNKSIDDEVDRNDEKQYLNVESSDMETSYNSQVDQSCLEMSILNEDDVNLSLSSNIKYDNEEQNNSFECNNISSHSETEMESSKDSLQMDDSMNDNNDYINDNSYYSEESRCISFVTTRRGNELKNVSILFLDDSCGSGSSSGYNKTVISNKIEEKECDIEQDCADASKRDSLQENTRLSFTSDRNTNQMIQGDITSKDNCSRESIFNNKPSIVLQPGKKWERSLSIYNRISLMTDHFDESILQDDLLRSKGRKYRQSVINTMEMQENLGSSHHESIISRRSSIFIKPRRSTIKIVKDRNSSSVSLSSSLTSEDLNGFLTEDCDDTILEFSKLSIVEDHEVTVVSRVHDSSGRSSTARDYVLRRCNQTDAILFDECYPDTVLKNCRKIGEGVYGEVFLWRASDGARVMKIVPIAGTTKVNGEQQKDFHEIISEIVIAMELSALRAPIKEIESHVDAGKDVDLLDLHAVGNATDVFNQVLAVRCVYGNYPSRLLDLWELFDECKGSENDNPDILPQQQQFIVLELANAGEDLESYQFNNAEQAHALFWQIAFGLAVGEEAFQFEHRDLHWGNILIAPTDQKFATFILRGRRYLIPRGGVAGSVIDYSLSRARLPLGAGEAADLYNDLSTDAGLFDAIGDYQFEVYRLMRERLGNDWKNFEPYTNILWLHYTVDKMITALRYKRTNTKVHKHFIAKLKGIKNRILDYKSTVQFVLTDNDI